jgi:hypothetical protein
VKKKKVKGKEVHCLLLRLLLVRNKRMIERESVLVEIEIKNENRVGIDVIDTETEAEVGKKGIAVANAIGIAVVSVTGIAVVKEKGIAVVANEVAQLNVHGTTEEIKTGIVETERIAKKTANQSEIEANEVEIVTNTAKRKKARRAAAAVLQSILRLQKPMLCEQSWGWLLCGKKMISTDAVFC